MGGVGAQAATDVPLGGATMSSKKSETVRVVVRCRPLSKKEVEDSRVKIVDMNCKSGEVAPMPAASAGLRQVLGLIYA